MTAHRTAGQLRALRELCALARTALSICDLLAERGAEESDAPRLWLLSLERWTRGEETGPQLGATTRALNVWQPGAAARSRRSAFHHDDRGYDIADAAIDECEEVAAAIRALPLPEAPQ